MLISWQTLLWLLYPSAIVALFGLAMWWRLRRRKTKHPLGEDVRLRRQPGEHLRKQLEKAWEGLIARLLLLGLMPFVVLFVAYYLTWLVLAPFPALRVLCTLASPIVPVGLGLLWVCRYADGILNLKLGLFGERAVADQLEGLKQKGYEVFHDVPCVGGSGPFNLDHVVVGNGVVVVVETKTLRKPKDMRDGHKVNYNGQVLTWPSGATSTRELEQAQRNAEWLRKELKKQVNVEATVHAALTFPGWFVNGGPPQAPVLVVTHKGLPSFIEKRFRPQLSPPETDAVVRHLNRLCTNLEYADVE